MSQGRVSPPLAPEDDWFDEPNWFDERNAPPSASDEPAQESRTRRSEPERPVERPARRRSWVTLGAAVVVALALLVGGVLVARALTGSDSGTQTTESSPTTTTAPTTTATTPETTTATTTTTTPGTTTSPDDDSDASLRPGDESEEVRQLQTDLVALGYSTGGVDGKYGPATEQAVREFQESSGLVVDGIAGAATLAALAEALNG
jgi:cytoskeletal protein RodZ